MARHQNRLDAGYALLEQLKHQNLRAATVVTLPGGSVAVALPIAHGLGSDLVVGYSEPAAETGGTSRGPSARQRMRDRAGGGQGSMFDGGTGSADRDLASRMHASFEEALEHLEHHEELPEVHGKSVVLVSDGLFDDRELYATAVALKRHGAKRLVVAVPMVSMVFEEELSSEVSEIVSLDRVLALGTATDWYETPEPKDEDLHKMLERYEGLQAFRRTFHMT